MEKYLGETIATYNSIATEYENLRHNASPQVELDRLVSFIPLEGLVLDAGCGPGRDTLKLREKGVKAYGIDLCENF